MTEQGDGVECGVFDALVCPGVSNSMTTRMPRSIAYSITSATSACEYVCSPSAAPYAPFALSSGNVLLTYGNDWSARVTERRDARYVGTTHGHHNHLV